MPRRCNLAALRVRKSDSGRGSDLRWCESRVVGVASGRGIVENQSESIKKQEEESTGWHTQAPRVSDAFRKDVSLIVTTWGGRAISGVVCDRDPAGILLEVREDGRDSDPVYVFLPWSSIEQVEIRGLAPRRVKFLRG